MLVNAAEVRLRVDATNFTMRGEILQFDGLDYLIRSALGRVLIDASFVTCEGPFCPSRKEPGAEFGIHGSNTIGAELLPALLRAYAEDERLRFERETSGEGTGALISLIDDREQRLMAAVDVRTEGSSTSFPALLSGEAAIGMASRRIRSVEIGAFADAGIGVGDDAPFREHVLGLDGLVAIVSDENPLGSLSIDDLARIFSGDARNWSEFGGADSPINVYARDEKSGTADTFDALVLAPRGLNLTIDAITYATNDEVSAAVAADPSGIGFTDFAHTQEARALTLETSCGLLVSPDEFGVKTEEYPLSRRLYLYTTGRTLPGKAASFLGYALSDAAQPVRGRRRDTGEQRPI